MNYLKLIYEALVAGQQKAIVGFVVAGLLSLLTLVGVTGEMTVREALTALFTALMTGLSVWVKANK